MQAACWLRVSKTQNPAEEKSGMLS